MSILYSEHSVTLVILTIAPLSGIPRAETTGNRVAPQTGNFKNYWFDSITIQTLKFMYRLLMKLKL